MKVFASNISGQQVEIEVSEAAFKKLEESITDPNIGVGPFNTLDDLMAFVNSLDGSGN